MSRFTTAVSVLLGLVIFMAVLVLAAQVGGVMMRNNVVRGEYVQLSVTEPVVRGVPVTVRWTVPNEMGAGKVKLVWRADRGEITLGEGDAASGSVVVNWPCENVDGVGTLVMTDFNSGQVLGYESVRVLPAGPECLP